MAGGGLRCLAETRSLGAAYVYVWGGWGPNCRARRNRPQNDARVIGCDPRRQGRTKLVGFRPGAGGGPTKKWARTSHRPQAQTWVEDRARFSAGRQPPFAESRGALGFWKASRRSFPAPDNQRCWVIRTPPWLKTKVALFGPDPNMKAGTFRDISGCADSRGSRSGHRSVAPTVRPQVRTRRSGLTKDGERSDPASLRLHGRAWGNCARKPDRGVFCRRFRHRTCGPREPCRPRPPSSWWFNSSNAPRKKPWPAIIF